jgi:predicted RNA binding protein YcfA (HicA-like mRNA interferase family)
VGTIPALSGHRVVNLFESLGWSVARRKGSHIVMVKVEIPHQIPKFRGHRPYLIPNTRIE